MKKKIAILHSSNTLNYGTMMMTVNFINRFNILSDESFDFYIDNDEPDGLDRTRISTGINNIYRLSDCGIYDINKTDVRRKNIVLKSFKYFLDAFIFGFKLKKANINHVVVLGGDDLSEGYGIKGILYQFLKLKSITFNRTEIVLLGQTIGPFYSWRKKLAKYILSKRVTIYPRDKITETHLIKDLLINPEKASKDLAFMQLPLMERFAELPVPFDKYITVVISGLYTYTKNKNLYIEKWVKILNKLIEEKKYNIVLLAHVLNDECSDKEIIDVVYEKLSFDSKSKVFCITETIYPQQARKILGKGLFTITGRMHAAISTFQMNKIALSLSYSVKYKGVIGGIGRDDLILEASGDRYWQENVVEDVIDKVEYIEKNYDKLISEITVSVKDAEVESENLVKTIYNKIGR
jgi:colanic acid/amylovoran biosynthesis protein